MAERAHITGRRSASSLSAGKTPPERRSNCTSLPHVGAGAFPIPLTLIDLEAHPDGELMRACAQATKLRDIGTTTAAPGQYPMEGAPARYWELISLICKTEACTAMGVTMKAIFVMDDRPDPDQHSLASLYASVIRDFLRTGVTP